jgi:hypothetical protein
MALTGPQRSELMEALIKAFPNEGALAQFVDHKLDLDLDTVAGGRNRAEVVFNLIRWAEANGRTRELVEKARESNPGNAHLRRVADQLQQAAAAPAPDPAGPPAAAVDRRALRQVMSQAFTLEELEALCADVKEELAKVGAPIDLDLDTVGGSSKEAKVLNLIRYFDRRGHLPYLVDAVRGARPGTI